MPTPAATGEPPAGRDEQVAQMFRNMRAAMGVSRETIARRLATAPRPSTTSRPGPSPRCRTGRRRPGSSAAIASCCGWTPEPILRRIHDRLLALASQPRSASASAAGAAIGQDRAHRTTGGPGRAHATRPAGARRRRARTLFALSAPIALLVGVAILAQVMPGLSTARSGCSPARSNRPCAPASTTSCCYRAPPRWAEMDRGRRSPVAQSRQIADKPALAIECIGELGVAH